MTVKTYSGLVTNVSKQTATVSLKSHGAGLADIRVPSEYKTKTGILGYEMGDTVNVALAGDRLMTTHKYGNMIFYVVFQKEGDELVITDQNLVDKADFEIDPAKL